MSMNTDRIKAMNFQHPESIPVRLGILPAGWMKYREALDDLLASHPEIAGAHQKDNRNYDEIPQERFMKGEYTDPWGCVWCNAQDGIEAIVKGHPLPEREMISDLKVPEEDMGMPHGFMYLRLTDLRGFEECMIDFAEEPPELQLLIDKVLEYNLRQLELKIAAEKNADILHFGDDLGHQHSLPMSPVKWRKYLKPCYQKLYSRCHEAGHSVYMHTDGQIFEIIPDLIDTGVNVINPQIRANGLDELVRTCKGKVCVDLDLDRQLFPFATPSQIDEHIHECVEALGSPEGGLWLTAEIDQGVSLENIEAICCGLEKYRKLFQPAA